MVVDESVGENFSKDSLWLARGKTLEVINEAARLTKPGMREAEAKKLITEIQKRLGAEKAWHPPQIRFGKNTLLSFGEKADPEVVLQENDIFFYDLGPLFESHEGDVGRTFAVGTDTEMTRCCKEVELIWQTVQKHWKQTKVSGIELYAFAAEYAKSLGWDLVQKGASGHRVADFPHTAKKRGAIRTFHQTPIADRWILEIQISHPTREFGAFYEDILS